MIVLINRAYHYHRCPCNNYNLQKIDFNWTHGNNL